MSKTNILYFVTFFTSIVFIVIITFTIHSIYTRELNIMKLEFRFINQILMVEVGLILVQMKVMVVLMEPLFVFQLMSNGNLEFIKI